MGVERRRDGADLRASTRLVLRAASRPPTAPSLTRGEGGAIVPASTINAVSVPA